jgi:hypothetical protein
MTDDQVINVLRVLAGAQKCELGLSRSAQYNGCTHWARRQDDPGTRFCVCCYRSQIGDLSPLDPRPHQVDCDGTLIATPDPQGE